MTNTKNPPGQVQDWKPPKYLRDVIIAAQQRSSEELSDRWAEMESAIADLRHLYMNLMNGKVVDQPSAATCLLGPAIAALERINDGRS